LYSGIRIEIIRGAKGGMMYVVTGGAGFIGSHIVEKLVSMGEKVRVLDNLSFGNFANFAGLEAKIEIISGDLLDPAAVVKAMEGIDVVLHQARPSLGSFFRR
jgi:UDP-N-acetylglucosamine 4-epimerase